MPDIPVLNVTPLGSYENGLPYYDFSCDLPLVKTLETGHPTIQEAYDEARKWSEGYEKLELLGLAAPLGVTEKDNKFFGVVNYFRL
jgi:hypothetical protein